MIIVTLVALCRLVGFTRHLLPSPLGYVLTRMGWDSRSLPMVIQANEIVKSIFFKAVQLDKVPVSRITNCLLLACQAYVDLLKCRVTYHEY